MICVLRSTDYRLTPAGFTLDCIRKLMGQSTTRLREEKFQRKLFLDKNLDNEGGGEALSRDFDSQQMEVY